MGNLIQSSESDINVLLMGLSGAGKTHLMVNSYLEDSWQSNYRNGPKSEGKNNNNGVFENEVRQ